MPGPAALGVRIVAALAGAAILAGCSSAGGRAGTASTAPPTSNVVSTSPVASPTSGEATAVPGLRIAAQHTFEVKSPGAISHLTRFGHWVGFAKATGSDSANEVWLLDTNSGVVRRVATSDWRHGQTDWVEGTEHWLAWTDQSAEQTDAAMALQWRIHVLDLATGRITTLARSAAEGEQDVPIPRAGDGYLTWATPDGGRGLALHVLRLRDARSWTVARHQVITDSGIAGGYLVYDTAGARHPNVFATPLTGGRTIQISRSGAALQPRAASGHAIWLEPPGQDPVVIAYSDLKAPARSVTLVRGANEGNAVVGADFAAFWDASGAVVAVPLAANAPRLVVSPEVFVPARMAALGRDLVFATDRTAGADVVVTIHVVTFR